MTDDPYASPASGATLPPPDVTSPTSDVPTRPFDLPPDFPVAPISVADAPSQGPGPVDVASQPSDAAGTTLSPEVAALISTDAAPDAKMVSLDVPVEVVDGSDGRKAEIIGDVAHLKDLIYQQGDNPYGFRGDCGLVSCRNIFKQFGFEATEQTVIAYAIAHGLCDTGKPGDPPEQLGGSTPLDQARILTDNGIPAHASEGRSLDDLAGFVQSGRGVIIGVDAGILWNDASALGNGGPNHAITVIGVVRDPSTQALAGFVVNDSGTGKTTVVSADAMNQCFVQRGGICVTTDNPAPRAQ